MGYLLVGEGQSGEVFFLLLVGGGSKWGVYLYTLGVRKNLSCKNNNTFNYYNINDSFTYSLK